MPNPNYKYSNGFDLLKVLPAFRNRLKWRSDGGGTSGRSVDSFHALVVEKHFRDSQANSRITDEEFSELKTATIDDAVMRALSSVFRGQCIIDPDTMLFDILSAKLIPADVDDADFVGYEFTVADTTEIVTQLKTVVLHFTASTPVKLYVFKAGSSTPIWEHSVNAIGNEYTIAELTNCYLSYGNQKATRFYFGYKPAELTGGAKPYMGNTDYSHTLRACGVQPVKVNSIPAVEGTVVYPMDPLGLNVEVHSTFDYTNRVIRAASLFDELIGLTHAAMIIEQIIFSTRNNGTERKLDNADKLSAMLELNGAIPVSDSPYILGLKKRISNEVESVRKSFMSKSSQVVSFYDCND